MHASVEVFTTASLLFGIVLILTFALLGRIGARKLGLPTVFGELLAGILVGNLFFFWGSDLMAILREGASCVEMARLTLSGHSWHEAASLVFGDESGTRIIDLLHSPAGSQYLQVSQAADMFLRYGLIFIMFYIGLGTHVISQLRGIDQDSLKVAVIGAFAPMALGYLVLLVLASDTSEIEHIFIAATLGTTGIAVSSRVFQRIRQHEPREAGIILGAAVMDDVLGLVMLAIATGIAATGSLELFDIGRTTIRAFLFLVCAFGVGPAFLRLLISMLSRFDVMEAKLFVSFILVISLAGLATIIHLSPIVGAFAAGLLLHESYFKTWGDVQQDKHSIRELFAPLEAIIVPVFFVLMGIQVRLETLLDWQALYVFAGLLAAAVIGKWISGLGVRGRVNRAAIGIGMMPRGDVGLAFAFIGKSLGVIDPEMFAVVVLVVVITTLVTPLLLPVAIDRK